MHDPPPAPGEDAPVWGMPTMLPEAQQAAILNQLAEGVIVTDAKGRIRFVNEAARLLHGVDDLDVGPEDYANRYHLFTEDGQPYPPLDLPLARAVRGETVTEARWCIRRPDGSEIVAVGSARPIHGPNRSQIGAALTLRDETARYAAERELRENEARLRALTDNMPGGMVYQIATDATGLSRRFTYVSQSHERLTGISAEAVLADPTIAYGLIVPEDRERLAQAEQVALRTGGSFDQEVRFRRVDGEVRWCRLISAPRRQPDGSTIWDGIQIDITEAKNAAMELAQSRERFEAVVDSIEQIVWSCRADGHHDYFNRRWYEYTGLEPGAEDGENWRHTIHPDDAAKRPSAWATALATGEPYHGEYRLRHRSGKYRWVLGKARPVRDESGAITRWFGTSTDIDDIVRARDVLARSHDELERLVAARTRERDLMWRASEDLFLICGFDGVYVSVNPAWTEQLGYPATQLIGGHLGSLVHPDDRHLLAAELERLQSGVVVRDFDLRVRARDGSYRWYSWHGIPDADRFYAAGRDVTGRRQLEEQLRQSQKMEAMGQLTGGVAHDFNNLLTPIIGSLDLLQRRGLGGERERRMIEGALQSAERAKTLVQRLLAFARRQPLQPSAVDLYTLIGGMADLLASTSGPQIRLIVDVATDLPAAQADPNQLEMAVLNLCVNARDAMPDGGTLTIAATAERLLPVNPLKLRPGAYLRLSVSDTGVGMDEAMLRRVVEPFFSTKGIGKGTGLGLSMVDGLASQLGGALALSSKVGLGTRVDLWLPVATQAAAAAEAVAPADAAPARRGLVLLVDDEAMVRMSSADMLTELGYAVIEADSADAALEVLAGHDVDLVVTDHLMPGMNGTDLARKVREAWPGLPVLLVSGYAEADGIAPDLPRLSKPFRQAELAASLAQLLGQSAVEPAGVGGDAAP